jgi:hypothetical protein
VIAGRGADPERSLHQQHPHSRRRSGILCGIDSDTPGAPHEIGVGSNS